MGIQFDATDINPSLNALGKVVSGLLGNVTCVLLFIAQFSSSWRVYQSKSGHTYSAMPHIWDLFTCCLWGMYSSPPINYEFKLSLLLLTASSVGIATQGFLIFMYLKSDPSRYDKTTVKKCFVTGFIVYLTLVISSVLPTHSTLLVIGYICMIWTSCVSLAPIIRKVAQVFIVDVSLWKFPRFVVPFRGKVFEVAFLIITIIHRSAWTCYGLFHVDPFILVAYASGVVCGVIELFIVICSGELPTTDTGNCCELPQLRKPRSSNQIDFEKDSIRSFQHPPSTSEHAAEVAEISQDPVLGRGIALGASSSQQQHRISPATPTFLFTSSSENGLVVQAPTQLEDSHPL